MQDKKLRRKLGRSFACLKKHSPEVNISESPTEVLFVGNGSPLCGISFDELLDKLSQFGHHILDICGYDTAVPYSFAVVESKEIGAELLTRLNEQQTSADRSNSCEPLLYLAYVDKLPKSLDEPLGKEQDRIPPGLRLLENFVTEDEAVELCAFVEDLIRLEEASATEATSHLKNRIAFHFGHAFVYGENRADAEHCRPLPPICQRLLLNRFVEQKLCPVEPDQMTINVYAAGQGIPYHTDSHSPFEEEISSLSLLSDVRVCCDLNVLLLPMQVVMTFKREPETTSDCKSAKTSLIPVLLRRRSLLLMTGESRFAWKHGILSRHYDKLPSNGVPQHSFNRLLKRGARYSLTFRKVRRRPCECSFPQYCDHDRAVGVSMENEQLSVAQLPSTSQQAALLEAEYVSAVYERIAGHFDTTRKSHWRGVVEFLQELPIGSVVLDVGCGNGKYLTYKDRRQLIKMGCDRSEELCVIGQTKGSIVAVADCLHLPYCAGRFDAAICVAVIHHMSTAERRRLAVEQVVRLLRAGGRALISVWAFEQEEANSGQKSTYLKWGDGKKSRNGEQVVEKHRSASVAADRRLPIHRNNMLFQEQDLLVPWNLKQRNSADQQQILLRYYHVFKESELTELCRSVENCTVVGDYYEQGNWIVLLEKTADVERTS